MNTHDEKTLQALAHKLRALRLERGLTQEDLSIMADLSREQIARMEAGKKNVSFLTLVAISKAMNITLSNLMDFPLPE